MHDNPKYFPDSKLSYHAYTHFWREYRNVLLMLFHQKVFISTAMLGSM